MMATSSKNQKTNSVFRNKTFRINFVAGFCTIVALSFIFNGSYIYAKALLAQYLIKSSWEQSIQQKQNVKPWSWADTWPVARMIVPQQQVDLIVLAGDTGRTLAFGPGFHLGSAKPGEAGNTVISAHRDTHFNFIKDLKLNQEITLQDQSGRLLSYRITGTQIIDTRLEALALDTDASYLTLVTCYPFDAIKPGGSLRYLVYAEKMENVLT